MDIKIELEGNGEFVLPNEIKSIDGIQYRLVNERSPLDMFITYVVIPVGSTLLNKFVNDVVWPFLRDHKWRKSKINGTEVNISKSTAQDILNILQKTPDIIPQPRNKDDVNNITHNVHSEQEIIDLVSSPERYWVSFGQNLSIRCLTISGEYTVWGDVMDYPFNKTFDKVEDAVEFFLQTRLDKKIGYDFE